MKEHPKQYVIKSFQDVPPKLKIRLKFVQIPLSPI